MKKRSKIYQFLENFISILESSKSKRLKGKWKYLIPLFKAIFWLLLFIPILYNRQFSGQYSWILFAGFITLFVKYYAPDILERKIKETNDYLIEFAKDAYKAEYLFDTEHWTKKIFYYNRTRINIIFLFVYLFLTLSLSILWNVNPGIIYNYLPFFSSSFDNSFVELISIIVLIYALLMLLKGIIELSILFYGVSDIIHHFSFWELSDDPHLQKSNPLGELVILNCFFSFITFGSFGFIYLIGNALAFAIFIFTPINPSRDYSSNIKKKYEKMARSMVLILILYAIYYFINIISFNSAFYHYITQTILLSLFIKTWRDLLKNKKKKEFTLDIKLFFEELAERMHISYYFLIVLISLVVPALIALEIYRFYMRWGYLSYEHLTIILGITVISMAIISLNFALISFKESTLSLAKKITPYLKKNKYEETIFHLWECFSGPQSFIFTVAVGLLLSYMALNYYFGYYSLSDWLRIPFTFAFIIIGVGIGNIIWLALYGPHLDWHLLSLLDPEHYEITKHITPKDFEDQFRKFSFLIGFGLYYFMALIALMFNKNTMALLTNMIPCSIISLLMYFIIKKSVEKGLKSYNKHSFNVMLDEQTFSRLRLYPEMKWSKILTKAINEYLDSIEKINKSSNM